MKGGKKMANEKIVVLLLLITIILSVVSVVLTLGINLPNSLKSEKAVGVKSIPQNGNLVLTVTQPNSASG
jgi:hypothetical protein